jgi:hypothetical protein
MSSEFSLCKYAFFVLVDLAEAMGYSTGYFIQLYTVRNSHIISQTTSMGSPSQLLIF